MRLKGWLWPAGVVVGTLLTCLPFFHLVSWIGDEGIQLRAAMELARGKALYREIFEFHPPGGFLIVWAWLSAFGQTLTAVRWLTTALAAGIALLTFLACRRVSGSNRLSATLAMLWVVASQGSYVQLNHHVVTTLIGMGALVACLGRRPGIAGLLCGAAGMVTQTRGMLTAIAALLSLPGGKGVWRFFAAIIIAPLGCLAFVIAQGAVQAAWEHVIVWPATQYGGIQSLPYGTYSNARSWWATATFPAALFLIAWRWSEVKADPVARTCAIFAVSGFVGAFPRPDAPLHLAINMPLALPMMALGMRRLGEVTPRRWRVAGIAVAISLATMSGARFALEAVIIGRAERVASPAGSVALTERGANEMLRQVTALPAEDRVFFYPYMPAVSFLAQREQVSAFDIFLPDYTTPAQYAQACREVARSAQWVVYDRRWTDPRQLKRLFPGMRNTSPPEFVAFEAMLAEGFAPVWSNQRFEIRRRRPDAQASCQ